MSTLLQLNPPISVLTPLGEGWAILVIDYDVNLNTVWVVSLWDSGELKHFDCNEVKMCGNPMYDIDEPTPFTERKV